MSTRDEPGIGTKHSVNPEVTGSYHKHERIERSNDPAHADGNNKSLAGEFLVNFVDHDDGFLKVRRALDSSDLHLTWTWSVGKHAGRYVYVRVFTWQVGYGLELLLHKRDQADAGLIRPSPDKLGHRP